MEDPSSSASYTNQSKTPTKQSSTIIMDKLKTSVIERLTKLYPNKALSPSQINSIVLHLQRAFPSFHIPTHPTYSTMIEKAIQELKEEDGSSEEAISEYILANYEDLPWAHKRFLSYYLDKLCKDGEVVCISSNRYSVPSLMDEFSKNKSLMMVEVDNLVGNAKNVDVSLFQEDGEEAGVVKCRVKRKRNALVLQHDEEEDTGGTGIVEGHDNVVENNEVPIDDSKKVLDDKVEAKGKDGVNKEHHIMAVDKVQSVVAEEHGSPTAPSTNLEDEVEDGGSSLARDPCEAKSEQMVSTMDKTLPGEQEEELRRGSLLPDHEISGANMMLVPSVSIDKLTNEPMNEGRVKRKRNSLVVQNEEEEEDGGMGIVEGQDNMVENSEVPVDDDGIVEEQDNIVKNSEVPVNDDGIVEGQDTIAENSEVPVNDDGKVLDGKVEVKGRDGTNEEHHVAAVVKFQSIVAVEQGSQSALLANLGDEVTNGGSSLACDPCEEKREHMASTMDKTLPGEHEEELRREELLSDHEIRGATMMLVPSLSIEKLTNEPLNGGPTLFSVSCVDFPKDTSDKLVVERKDQDSSTADLAIVAVEKGSPKVNREVVCCLFVSQPEQPKIRSMFRPKKKSKRFQVGKPTTSGTPTTASPDFTEGPKMRHVYHSRKKGLHEGFSTRALDMKLDPKLLESSISETPLQSQQGHKSSVLRSKLMISIMERSVKHEHGEQKLQSDSSSSSLQSELMSMEDGDLNLPLKQVIKMHAKRRKSSMHAKVSKLAARSEDPAEKMPLKGKKMTRRKRKQVEFQYDGQKSCGSEAVAEPRHEIDREGQSGSFLVHVTSDTFGFDDRHHESGENEQIKGGHDHFHKSGQYDGVNPRESSQAEDKNALKDLEHPAEHHHQQQEKPSEPATSLILEEAASMVSLVSQEIMEEENEGKIVNSPVESPFVKPSSPSHHDLKYDDINPSESSKVENENALNDLKHPIEHHQQQERPFESATNLILEEASSVILPVYQGKTPEEENNGGIANPPLESPSLKSSSPSHLDLEEDPLKQKSDVQHQHLVSDLAISVHGKMPRSSQQSLWNKKEVKKIECRGRPPRKESENQDGLESVNSHSLKLEGLFDTVSYHQSDPQNKQRKSDGHGTSPNQKEAIDVVPLSLHGQQLEEQSKSDSGQPFVEELSAEDVAASVSLNGRLQGLSESGVLESDRITIGKQIVVTKEVVSLYLHDQQIERQLKPATCKEKKKDRRGRPRKTKETIVKDIPAPLDLYAMLQKELAQAVICQSENKDGGESSTRQTEPMTQDVGAVGLHDQQLEGQSEQATNESRTKEVTTEDMVAAQNFQEQLQEKQIEAANKDVATDLDLHDQQQKGSFVQTTHEMKEDGEGRALKSEVSEKSPLDLDLQQQESPSKLAIHPSADASNLFCLPVERKRQQLNVSGPVGKLLATVDEPISLRTRSKKSGAHKPEAAVTLLRSEGDYQGKEVVLILSDEEFHQQEVVPETDQEKKQWQSSSGNPEESEAEVHKSPSKPEQVTNGSDDESLLVDQPCKIEGQRQDSIGKQLGSQTTVLKQKSNDHIPLSAIRRSQRINQRSQTGS